MNSEYLIVLAHILILAGLGVWAIRAERSKWLVILLPITIVGLSWWWTRDPSPRDAPDWVIVVMVAGYALGTIVVAGWAPKSSDSVILQVLTTVAGGVILVIPAAILAFIAWGVATSL